MITSHVITVYYQCADETEVELSANVSLVKGTRDELEIEWLGESADAFDALFDSSQEALEQTVRVKWWERMAELDQDSEEVERADYEMDQRKDDKLACNRRDF